MEDYTKRQQRPYFSETRKRLERLIDQLEDENTLSMDHSEVESLIEVEGRNVLRQALQDHLDLRHLREERFEGLVGSDGIPRKHVRVRERTLRSIFGTVTIRRYSYSAPEIHSLRPIDAELNLPEIGRYSYGLLRRMVENAIRMSYDATSDNLYRTAGLKVPKRQIEEQVRYSSLGFREFYETKVAKGPQQTDDLMILSTDGKGVVMRYKDLRYKTQLRADEAKRKQKGCRLDTSTTPHRKRMSTVAAVYSTPRIIRTPEELMNIEALPDGVTRIKRKAPRPTDKRVWASLMSNAEEVIESVFKEAARRDPEHKRSWVYLVDGDLSQLGRIRKAAQRQNGSSP